MKSREVGECIVLHLKVVQRKGKPESEKSISSRSRNSLFIICQTRCVSFPVLFMFENSRSLYSCFLTWYPVIYQDLYFTLCLVWPFAFFVLICNVISVSNKWWSLAMLVERLFRTSSNDPRRYHFVDSGLPIIRHFGIHISYNN